MTAGRASELRDRVEGSLHRLVAEPATFVERLTDAGPHRSHELYPRILGRHIGE
jgi:hypothetical protein